MKETNDTLGSLSPEQLRWLSDRIKDGTIKVPEETILPEGTKFFVVGRTSRRVWCEEYVHGLVVDAGPSMLSLALFSDHSVENANHPNYPGYDGMRWYLTKEEAEEAVGKPKEDRQAVKILGDSQRAYYKYEIRSSGYAASTVYARDPDEALLVYRNNCGRGEAGAGLDYLICRGYYDLVKGEDLNFDAFEVVFARVDKTCDGEPIPPARKGAAE